MIANIAWIAIRELLYEKVFYVLVLFCVMALGLSLLLGQLTYAEQAKLTLDFMLAGIDERAPDADFAARLPRAEKYVGWPMLVVLRLRAAPRGYVLPGPTGPWSRDEPGRPSRP